MRFPYSNSWTPWVFPVLPLSRTGGCPHSVISDRWFLVRLHGLGSSKHSSGPFIHHSFPFIIASIWKMVAIMVSRFSRRLSCTGCRPPPWDLAENNAKTAARITSKLDTAIPQVDEGCAKFFRSDPINFGDFTSENSEILGPHAGHMYYKTIMHRAKVSFIKQ